VETNITVVAVSIPLLRILLKGYGTHRKSYEAADSGPHEINFPRPPPTVGSGGKQRLNFMSRLTIPRGDEEAPVPVPDTLAGGLSWLANPPTPINPGDGSDSEKPDQDLTGSSWLASATPKGKAANEGSSSGRHQRNTRRNDHGVLPV
jgi:hypothetical protein